MTTKKESSENRNLFEVSVQRHRRMEAPLTPGRQLFSFGGGNLSRKSIPSKWDDAEKWLISGSCRESPAYFSKPSDSSKISIINDVLHLKGEVLAEKVRIDENSAFNGVPSEVTLQDKFTENAEPPCPTFRFTDPSKEGFLLRGSYCELVKSPPTEEFSDVQHRDIGTSMTPLGSIATSRCHTPIKSSSPPRHNSPLDMSDPLIASYTMFDISELECHFAKLNLSVEYDLMISNWSSWEEEEVEVSKSLRKNFAETKASLWEDEERTNICIRYQREEAKIRAWVNLQSAKAEAQSRKLEVKIEKMRSKLEERLMKRMTIVQRRAEEWRASAQLHNSQQMLRVNEHARNNENRQTSQVASCSCFPCNNRL